MTALLVPLAVVTVTETIPVPGGATAVTWESDTTVNETAAAAPKRTAVVPLKPVPVKVTVFPPAGAPCVGLIEDRLGATAP